MKNSFNLKRKTEPFLVMATVQLLNILNLITLFKGPNKTTNI